MRATRTLSILLLAAILATPGCFLLSAVKNRLRSPEVTETGITFRYEAPAAQVVTLAGNFNNWGGTQGGGRYDPGIDPMLDPERDGIWELTLPLPPGRYQYKYVIDQVRWEQDPSNPYNDQEAGIENSLVIVPGNLPYETPQGYLNELMGTSARGARGGGGMQIAVDHGNDGEIREVTFRLERPGASQVFVAGDFNDWVGDEVALSQGADGSWEITIELPPGRHLYKYVVDGTWIEDPDNSETEADPFGGFNSVRVVE